MTGLVRDSTVKPPALRYQIMANGAQEHPAMIGLTRIYCHQHNEFRLVDVASQESNDAAEQLREDGWDIEAEIPV